jgi:hypothetical protein
VSRGRFGVLSRTGSVRRVEGVPEQLEAVLAGVTARLRTMTAAKLGAPLPGPFATRADAARVLGAALAIAAQGAEDADAPAMPRWRLLPELPDLAVGDQLTVLSHDLRVAVGTAPAEVWTPQGRAPLIDVLRDVLATAEEVARVL